MNPRELIYDAIHRLSSDHLDAFAEWCADACEELLLSGRTSTIDWAHASRRFCERAAGEQLRGPKRRCVQSACNCAVDAWFDSGIEIAEKRARAAGMRERALARLGEMLAAPSNMTDSLA